MYAEIIIGKVVDGADASNGTKAEKLTFSPHHIGVDVDDEEKLLDDGADEPLEAKSFYEGEIGSGSTCVFGRTTNGVLIVIAQVCKNE